MLKPNPRVSVTEWSKSMRIKRRWEVRVWQRDEDGDDDPLFDGVVIARFVLESDARACGERVKAFLASEKQS